MTDEKKEEGTDSGAGERVFGPQENATRTSAAREAFERARALGDGWKEDMAAACVCTVVEAEAKELAGIDAGTPDEVRHKAYMAVAEAAERALVSYACSRYTVERHQPGTFGELAGLMVFMDSSEKRKMYGIADRFETAAFPSVCMASAMSGEPMSTGLRMVLLMSDSDGRVIAEKIYRDAAEGDE